MSDWQTKAKRLIAARDAKIPKEWLLSPSIKETAHPRVLPVFASCGLLSSEELAITDPAIDATALVDKIAKGEWSAVQVTLAYCKRAAIAQQLVDCLVDFFPEEALATAKELDEYYKTHGKTKGPLHGLPISIKGHNLVKGKDSGAGGGVLAWDGKFVGKEDAYWIQILRDAGAVFYCRCSLPQAVMQLECHSFWGETTNPHNTTTSPGGSSGGDAALMAAGGSPLGLGGDIGGSLRGPASYSGLWTLKCSSYRLPRFGAVSAVLGNEAIVSVNGALTRSLRDLVLFHQTISDAEPWLVEPATQPRPWNMKQDWKWKGQGGKIRVGVLSDDGYASPVAPMLRAIAEVAKALKKDDRFEVVEYQPYKTEEAVSLAHELYFTDGGKSVRDAAAESGEPILPLTEWVLSYPSVKNHTIKELWDLTLAREALRSDIAKHWTASGIDVLLCPPTPGPAAKLQSTKYWGYTNYFNFTDQPGVVFNTGLTANQKLDAPFANLNRAYRNPTEEHIHETYKQTDAEGLPLGVQIVGYRYADERTLAAAMQIEESFKKL